MASDTVTVPIDWREEAREVTLTVHFRSVPWWTKPALHLGLWLMKWGAFIAGFGFESCESEREDE